MDIEEARRTAFKLFNIDASDVASLSESIDKLIEIRDVHGINIFEDTKLQLRVYLFTEPKSEYGFCSSAEEKITCLDYIWIQIASTTDEQLILKICEMGYRIPEKLMYHIYMIQEKDYITYREFKDFIKSIETKCEIKNSLGEISNSFKKRSKL